MILRRDSIDPALRECREVVAACALGTLLMLCALCCSAQVATQSDNLSLLKDAAQLISAGNLDRAENELQSILNADPNEYRALNFMGIVRAQQGRNAAAEKLFKQVIQQNPNFASAHVNLGLLYVQMSRSADAIPEFQEALRIDPTRTDALNSLLAALRNESKIALQNNDGEKALSFMMQARQASPNDPEVLYEFGMAALRMSLFPDAIQAFQSVLKVRKEDAKAIYALGRAQMGLAKYQDARDTFAHYVQLNSGDASGHYALALTLASLQQFPEAKTEFERSIQLKPVQTESYFQLGRLELNAGDLGAAGMHFIYVLQRDPHHAGALTGMGRIEFEKKNYDEAAKLLERAVTVEPSLREAHYYLGLSYARLGRKEDSAAQLKITNELDQEEVKAHNAGVEIINPGEDSSTGADKH
jgi:tetratricopeptide (TPR) repeat protein